MATSSTCRNCGASLGLFGPCTHCGAAAIERAEVVGAVCGTCGRHMVCANYYCPVCSRATCETDYNRAHRRCALCAAPIVAVERARREAAERAEEQADRRKTGIGLVAVLLVLGALAVGWFSLFTPWYFGFFPIVVAVVVGAFEA